jgi:hypothetical protein
MIVIVVAVTVSGPSTIAVVAAGVTATGIAAA